MRMSKLVGRQIKESPKDAQSPSHVFLIRGGYIRMVSTGIYTLLPLGAKIAAKVEQIIREEMNGVDGQECLMPVVLPRELWDESGRYEGVGPELLRFEDRNGKEMLLGMTHEEAVVHMVRTEVNSYKQLPMMVYQVQTKYRDEARPRAGLIRVREFTMKDGYSFHATEACLESYYDRVHDAYTRIFDRLGMKNVVSIEADSGMMGGAISHEFMAIADCGEDTLFLSPDGSYRANREVARTGMTFTREDPLPLEKVHTPGQKSIADVAAFVNKSTSETGKAVFYVDDEGKLVFVFIRGDLDVNEGKLRKVLQSRVEAANDGEIMAAGAVPGYASLLNIDFTKVRVVVDPSAAESSNLVVGANEVDYHMLNFNFARDLGENVEKVTVADIATARTGDPCPLTGAPLEERRGIEVGNIFQLGTKYSSSMGCNYLDVNGKSKTMIMGCYGIGVGRSIASVIEQSHDDYGPIWPVSIAPYHVHIVALNSNKQGIKEVAEQIYSDLASQGIEVLFDDRNKKAGFAFSDADLIGAPFRIIISPKTVRDGQVEFKTRDGSRTCRFEISEAVAKTVEEVNAALAAV